MGWAVGRGATGRDIGYGVPATCDQPQCAEKIDRGLAHACGTKHLGGTTGCGLYFCDEHLVSSNDDAWFCGNCTAGKPPHPESPDTVEWLEWKLTDSSWEKWRQDNPVTVEAARVEVARRG